MTPERYKKLTDWLEGHPALRKGIILLNRWLPLVPFVCYPALLLLLNLRWFAMLRAGRGGGALDFMQVIARAILVPGGPDSTFPALMSSRALSPSSRRAPAAIPAPPATL